eukprot:3941949-Rhodomonas_salina.2
MFGYWTEEVGHSSAMSSTKCNQIQEACVPEPHLYQECGFANSISHCPEIAARGATCYGTAGTNAAHGPTATTRVYPNTSILDWYCRVRPRYRSS